MPRFSIVIPTHNTSEHISSALRSVEQQSYQDFEVIIVDDDSDDFSELQKIVDRFAKKFIVKLIALPEKKNASAGRNLGIEIATGQYIALLDADDEWEPDKLKLTNSAILRASNPTETIFFSKIRISNLGKERVIQPHRAPFEQEHIADYMLAYRNVVQSSAIAFSKSIYDRVPFDETLPRHQDVSFLLSAHRAGLHFTLIPEVLSTYNFPTDGLRKRVRTGRMSSLTCQEWLSKYRDDLTPKAVVAYRFFVLGRILLLEGKMISGGFMLMSTLLRFDRFMLKALVRNALKRL